MFHCVYIYIPHLFIHLSINGYLGCLYLLAILNNAAINMGVQISLCDPAFNAFVRIPRSGIVESYGNFIFNFLRNYHAVFHIICTVSHSYQECTRVIIRNWNHIFPNICYFMAFFAFVFFFFLIAAILTSVR